MRNYVVCHYAKCYGPTVNYTTHIERKKADGSEHIPYNIKRSDLTKHNREFIAEAMKIGRSAAIEKRLIAVKYQKDKEGNEYERKLRKDLVCCIEIRLSASPEAMAEIIEHGRLMEWCRESVKWAQREHGKENIVSAVSTVPENTLGRPPLRPLALAASSPDFVRCRMRSLSNWDSPAKIVKSRLPCGVVVSSHVSRRDFIEAPASCTLSMMANSSLTERPSRVSSVIITVSPSLKASSIRSSSGRLTSILENLELCGFIVKTTQPNKKSKDAIFQLVDNFSLFYHEFIRNKIKGSNYWSSNYMTPAHSAWSGLAFERLCFQHRTQITKALGISGIHAIWYAWSAPKTESYTGVQVDMVIDRADGMVNLCEVKFTEEPFAITPEYMQNLRLRRSRYQQEIASKKGGGHLTMVTSSGVVQNPQKFETNSFVTLDDLFAE